MEPQLSRVSENVTEPALATVTALSEAPLSIVNDQFQSELVWRNRRRVSYNLSGEAVLQIRRFGMQDMTNLPHNGDSNFEELNKMKTWRCRGCFEGVGLKDIFEVRIDDLLLWEVIKYCTHEEVPCNNELPSKLCTSCFDKLKDTYFFIKEYKQTQKKFLDSEENVINDYDTKVDIDDDFKGFLNHYESETGINGTNDDKTKIDDQLNLCLTPAQLETTFGNEAIEEIAVKPEMNDGFEIEEEILDKTGNMEMNNEARSDIKEEILDTNENKDEISEKKLESSTPSEVKMFEESLKSFPPHFMLINSRKEPNTQCFECLTVFLTGSDLKRHSKETGHAIAPTYKCELCERVFKFRNRYKSHLRDHETKLQDSVCEICGACVRTVSLPRHMQRHGSGNKCPDCGKNFTQKGYLQTHMKKHHLQGNPKKELCHICGIQKNTLSTLNQHMNKKHGEASSWSHQCGTCNLSFFSKFSLSLHIQKMHTENSVCKKTSTRIKPKRSVDGVEVEAVESTNEQKKEIKKRKRRTKIDLDGEDGAKKLVKCSVCSKEISSPAGLYQHMLIHKDSKPYECKVCSKAFRMCHQLKSHMNIHLDLKPYECEFCKKCFRHQTTLRIHKRSHTGETPYVCRFCQKGFAHSSSMKKHEETHSKKEPRTEKIIAKN